MILPLATAFAADFVHLEQVAVAAFPEGVQVVTEQEWKFGLYPAAKSGLGKALTEGNFISVGLHEELTPSFPRVGPMLRFAPVAIWDVQLGINGTWYFGAFSSLLPLDSGDTVADKAWKRQAVQDGERLGGIGLHTYGSTRLKMRGGPIIGVVELAVQRNDIYPWSGQIDWYWDPADMINVNAHGYVIRRNAYLFAELIKPADPDDRKLWIGPVLQWTSNHASDDRNVRLGPVMFWKPARGDAIPNIIAGVQPWLVSRFVSTWPPYCFVAARWGG